MNELALFAGAGGGILASHLLGWHTVGACEIEDYPRRVLLQRQRDGFLPEFPIWDDVCSFDGKPWAGLVDVVSGGFPCQDISAAGRGEGITGERSGLWKEYARIIGEVRPRFVFAENSPLLRTRGLGVVLKDLNRLGYDARWCVLGAWHVGFPHKRDRMWVLAHPKVQNGRGHRLEDSSEKGPPLQAGAKARRSLALSWEQTEQGVESKCGIRSLDDGLASRMGGPNKAIGNGQVPAVAATAFRILSRGLI